MTRRWDNLAEACWIERATQQNPWWFRVKVRASLGDGSVLVEPTSRGHYLRVSEDWTGCRCAFAPDGGADSYDSQQWVSGKVDVVDVRGPDEAPMIAIALYDPAEAGGLPEGSLRNLSVREHDFYEGLTGWADAASAPSWVTWGETSGSRGASRGQGGDVLGPDAWMQGLARLDAEGGVRPNAPAAVDFDASKRRALEGVPRRVRAIWGPPGTGKTFTAGHLVASQLGVGKRVLVLSISNRAVDQAILGADDAWRQQHGGKPPPDTRTLVRVREPRHPDLQRPERGHLIAGWHEAVRPWRDARSRVLTQLCSTRDDAERIRLRGELNQIKEALENAQKALIEGARAVFATLTHQRMSNLMPVSDFDLVIVDEAGFVGAAVATMIASQAGDATQVVFAGDFQQLGPIVGFKAAAHQGSLRSKVVRRPFPPRSFHDADGGHDFPWVDDQAERQARVPVVNGWFADSAYAILGLEDRLVGRDPAAAARRARAADEGWLDLLDVQRRMPAPLCDFISERVYGGLGVVTSPPGWTRPPGPLCDAHGRRPPMLWLNAAEDDGRLLSGWTWQLDSVKTAQICVKAALRALADPECKVFILTRFNAQVRTIHRELQRALGEDPAARARVEVTTVHKAQGGEREVVIFDTICTTPWWLQGQPMTSRDWRNELRLINVALSRAKRQVLVLLHAQYAPAHPILGEYLQVASRVWPRDLDEDARKVRVRRRA